MRHALRHPPSSRWYFLCVLSLLVHDDDLGVINNSEAIRASPSSSSSSLLPPDFQSRWQGSQLDIWPLYHPCARLLLCRSSLLVHLTSCAKHEANARMSWRIRLSFPPPLTHSCPQVCSLLSHFPGRLLRSSSPHNIRYSYNTMGHVTVFRCFCHGRRVFCPS